MVHAVDETTAMQSLNRFLSARKIHISRTCSNARTLKARKNNTECDALLINSDSQTDTYPAITVQGEDHSHSTSSVSKVSAEQIFYMQRGLSEADAMSML